MDGKSFLPLLTGGVQTGREKVFTVFEETVAKIQYPMRCVQDAKFGYIYNAWSNGTTVFRNEASGTPTFRAMQASTDPKIAERVKFFQYRAPEELYDFESDPSALKNLASDPKHKATLEQMRKELLENMTSTKDHVLDAYKTYLATGKQAWQPEVRKRFPGGRKGKAAAGE
jgi:N-sulfoglucosamine sulfohydrolase